MKEFTKFNLKKRIHLISLKRYSLLDAYIIMKPKDDVPTMKKEHFNSLNHTIH